VSKSLHLLNEEAKKVKPKRPEKNISKRMKKETEIIQESRGVVCR